MGFCSYSREFSLSSYTSIENQFIDKYMASADGDAVKVYIFGLYLCQNVQGDYTLAEASRALNMPETRIVDLFKFWEDFDLLEIVSYQPFSVRYYPADYSKGKPKRIRTEKYTEFNKALQTMLPGRMISANEYMKYFSVMEEFAIRPEAMLLIVRYCIDLKGEHISQNYILQVAKNFAAEGITTVEQVENKLSDYVVRGSDISDILHAMGSSRKPEPDDYKLLKKWTEELGFELPVIRFAASLHKKSTFARLDEILGELYANKKFTQTEVKDYLSRKTQIRELTIGIARELGVYCQVVDTYTDNFVSGWLAAGFDDASLLTLAKYCFRREKKSFEKMDELIHRLLSVGVISAESIADYIENEAREQTFAAEVLKTAGVSRRVNNWDRECLRNWRNWNFSDEMILKAAEAASGKASPVPYMNSVLSSWKAKGIFTPERLDKEQPLSKENFFAKQQREEENAEFRARVRNYYFNLREKAENRAEYYRRRALADTEFSSNEEEMRATEIRLAKAEALGGDVSELRSRLTSLKKTRGAVLSRLGLTEEMLVPQYKCKICNDTGFDKDGNVCECYKRYIESGDEQERLSNILDAYSNIDI